MKDLFPKNQKEHPMITRFQENFEVENAHTTRLLNSPVVYMQRLLNEAQIEMNQQIMIESSYSEAPDITIHSEFLCLQFPFVIAISLLNKPILWSET